MFSRISAVKCLQSDPDSSPLGRNILKKQQQEEGQNTKKAQKYRGVTLEISNVKDVKEKMRRGDKASITRGKLASLGHKN